MAANLTDVAIKTRKMIRYGIFFVIFLIGARIAFGIGAALYTALVPKKLPPPTVAFGPLPAINFPVKDTQFTLTYVLETPSGSLPNAPTQLPIYYMPPLTATLVSADNAKTRARALGFASEPNPLTQTQYEFVHQSLPKTLRMNIVTGEFSMNYNLLSDQSPLQGIPPRDQDAVAIASRALTAANSMPADLAAGTTSIDYLKIRDQQQVAALSLSDASMSRVNFFRKSYGPNEKQLYPSVTSTPGRGNVWAMVTGSPDREKQVVLGEYHYFPVDEEQSATYPIKSTQTAYSDLQAGRAYIAQYNSAGGNSTKIRNVYLAYYDPDIYNPNSSTNFYQPVFVFEGDNQLVAYVPAVTSDYYGLE